MSKICEIIGSADVFKTKQNLRKHSTVRYITDHNQGYKSIENRCYLQWNPPFFSSKNWIPLPSFLSCKAFNCVVLLCLWLLGNFLVTVSIWWLWLVYCKTCLSDWSKLNFDWAVFLLQALMWRNLQAQNLSLVQLCIL